MSTTALGKKLSVDLSGSLLSIFIDDRLRAIIEIVNNQYGLMGICSKYGMVNQRFGTEMLAVDDPDYIIMYNTITNALTYPIQSINEITDAIACRI